MQNHIEKEAKILEINRADVVRTLEKLGARKILDAVTIIETYDIKKGYSSKKGKNPGTYKRFLPILEEIKTLTKRGQTLLSQGAYLRLRQEGSRSELILKYSEGSKNARIKSEREISIGVRNKKEWKSVQQLLQHYGLANVFYQEKQRVSYAYEPLSLRFDIDRWPGVPTYVEIEGKSQSAIEKGARLLGYRASDLLSYKAKEVFKKYSVSPVYLSFTQDTVRVVCKKLLNTMQTVLRNYGLSKKDTYCIARHYWEAELMGKQSHGVRKFCWDFQYYGERQGKPKVISDTKAVALVDGCREIGPLAAQFCVELVAKKAKQYGIAMVGLKNFQRYGALSTWAREITKAGLVGIVINSTESFVIPPNGETPVLGTNPISIGYPTGTDPIIMDMATAKAPMSLVWYERMRGGILPHQTFVDTGGAYTTNPWMAKWVEVWGGVKGFHLSLMLQLLNGSLLGVKTERTWEDSYQVGAVFIAINPKLFRPLQGFKKDVSKFLDFVRMAQKNISVLPGEHSRKQYKINQRKGFVILPKQVWEWLNLL